MTIQESKASHHELVRESVLQRFYIMIMMTSGPQGLGWYFWGFQGLAITSAFIFVAFSISLFASLKNYKNFSRMMSIISGSVVSGLLVLFYPFLKGTYIILCIGAMSPFFLFSPKTERNIFGFIFVFNLAISMGVVVSALVGFDLALSDIPNQLITPVDIMLCLTALTVISAYASIFTYINLRATQRIEEQKESIEQILSNINEGIFTVGTNGKINPDYSKWMEFFFQRNNLDRLSLDELVYEGSAVGHETKAKIDHVVSSIGDNIFDFEANSEALPIQYPIHINNEVKFIELNWSAIEKQQNLAKIIFIIKDITESTKLKKDLEKQNLEVSLITTLIVVGIDRALHFLKSSKDVLDGCMKSSNIREILVDLHTIKGNSLTIGLRDIAAIAHQTEDLVKSRLHEGVADSDTSKDLEKLSTTIHQYLYIVDKYLGSLISLQNQPLENAYQTLETHLKRDLDNTQKIAKEMGIASISFSFEEVRPLIPANKVVLLQNVFGHCLRNSLSHSIETPKDRMIEGKNPNSRIDFRVYRNESGTVVIRYRDDGRGLNLEKIKQKGLASQLIDKDASDEDLAQLIFTSEFTTKDSVDSLSGRGIGMDAIKTMLRREGSKIDLNFIGPRTAKGFRPFELVIYLTV